MTAAVITFDPCTISAAIIRRNIALHNPILSSLSTNSPFSSDFDPTSLFFFTNVYAKCPRICGQQTSRGHHPLQRCCYNGKKTPHLTFRPFAIWPENMWNHLQGSRIMDPIFAYCHLRVFMHVITLWQEWKCISFACKPSERWQGRLKLFLKNPVMRTLLWFSQ